MFSLIFNSVPCYSQKSSDSFCEDDLEEIPIFEEFVDRFKVNNETFEDFILDRFEAEVFLSNENIYKNSNNRNKKIVCCNNEEFEGLTCDDRKYYLLDDGFIDDYGEGGTYSILTFPINRLQDHSPIDSMGDILIYWLDNKIRPLKFESKETKKTYDLLRNILLNL